MSASVAAQVERGREYERGSGSSELTLLAAPQRLQAVAQARAGTSPSARAAHNRRARALLGLTEWAMLDTIAKDNELKLKQVDVDED